jgi:hypothetical protein
MCILGPGAYALDEWVAARLLVEIAGGQRLTPHHPWVAAHGRRRPLIRSGSSLGKSAKGGATGGWVAG